MPRTSAEWIGKTDDTPVPARVRLRVLDRYDRQCDTCKRDIRAGDSWTCDHVKPLILGGPNRENNLHPLCAWCHGPKTAGEVQVKSQNYKRARKHAGIKTRRTNRPLIGTIASGWKKHMNGEWARR
jgi:hypothetical protein